MGRSDDSTHLAAFAARNLSVGFFRIVFAIRGLLDDGPSTLRRVALLWGLLHYAAFSAMYWATGASRRSWT